MKKERKEILLNSFPALPEQFRLQMTGRGAQNFVIFLVKSKDAELYARCYHRYANGCIVERQRYVFAKDGVVRYGKNDNYPWEIRKDFREPVFCQSGYGYAFDNSYCVLNAEAIKQSCLKYAIVDTHTSWLFMSWLKLYIMHPNVEYLVKAGYSFLITEYDAGFYGGTTHLEADCCINWKTNKLLKMLGLNRSEFKALQGKEQRYHSYRLWRHYYPKYKIDELLMIAEAFGVESGTASDLSEATGLTVKRLSRYLVENDIRKYDYRDYVEQCRKLKYDLHDTAVSMPYDFHAMHTRCSNIIKYGNGEGLSAVFAQNMEQRKQLEYEGKDLMIRQPSSFDEIVNEGARLHHCVGGYAERHALGKLHIMFIRRKEEPDKPYYTMEVSTIGKIVQVRGLRNCDPTEEVKALVEDYKVYLDKLYKKQQKTSKRCRKAAERITA